MKTNIRKVAVLGSGVMGSAIACHFANVGCSVLLLDIVPKEAEETDKKAARNKLVNDALKASLKSKPSPIYSKSFANRIETGNMTDDMNKIADCDWIIEVVVERLDIKKIVFENLTLAPIDKELTNYNLLSLSEKNYLFNYHLNVYSKISKYLNLKEKKWLTTFI